LIYTENCVGIVPLLCSRNRDKLKLMIGVLTLSMLVTIKCILLVLVWNLFLRVMM